jgi:hypothetical protein
MTTASQIERLHYFNGRRLEAADLALEQRYHLEMRRRLNRELFTPGVVSGLEVMPITGDATHVLVKTGLALDPLGRELVIDEQTVAVPGQPPPAGRDGYLLVARYHEERLPADDDPCRVPGSVQYARVRETPEIQWTAELPMHTNCEQDPCSIDCAIVLAFVRMVACEVAGIEAAVREVSHPAHTSQASVMALEGEKDLDPDNKKVLHFVPRGGEPSSVVLYLWGGKFSSLFYTQMGHHNHVLKKESVDISTAAFPDHQHGLTAHTHRYQGAGAGKLTTDSADLSHHHKLLTEAVTHNVYLPDHAANKPYPQTAVATVYYEWRDVGYREQSDYVGDDTGHLYGPKPWIEPVNGNHGHTFDFTLEGPVKLDGSPTSGTTDGVSGAVAGLSHSMQADATVTSAGSPDYAAGSGAAYGYLDHLKVALDGVDVTDEILKKLGWTELGDSTEGHKLNHDGTGGIDMLEVARAVGKSIEDTRHELVFSVDSGGGQILYNLYVE